MTLNLTTADTAAALAELGRQLQAVAYRFITVTPATHRRVNRRPENAMAHDLRGVLGWSLLREGGLSEACEVDGTPARRALVRVSSIGEHLYFHSAWPTDEDNSVFFGPDTYRYVAALARSLDELQRANGRPILRAVDIGSGGGAGAIELALRRPDATVYGADINDDALALTAVNAQLNGAGKVVPCRSNLLDGVDGGLDAVMSNPPYILDADELPYRHGGGEHGAQLSIDIVKVGLERLNPGGSLLLYTGVAIVEGEDRFLTHVRPLLDEACGTWRYEELDPDIFGGQLGCDGYENVERIAAVWLHAVKRG
jgi:methylase of polypeptide subunit release factors